MDLNQVTVPCIDDEISVRFYKMLRLRQIVDSPSRYARLETDAGSSLSIHLADRLCIDQAGENRRYRLWRIDDGVVQLGASCKSDIVLTY